ncbi:hypothetical protein BH11ARM1_BH11ARM1_14500 [soil metagenome]
MNRLSFAGLALASLFVVGCGSKGETAPTAAKAPSPAALARRSVKSTLDTDASKIVKTPKVTTIEDMMATKAPEGDLAGRVAPFETTTWQVEATIKSVELKKDGDFYMVLEGDKGGQTVVEVPDPKTVVGSPFEADITTTRKELEEKYHPTPEVKELNEKATITGVGFLGWGKKGKAATGKSGPRLNPGTTVTFKKGG